MKLPANRPIRRIVIAGNGIEGWLTAALLSHRLDARQVEIVLCPVTGANDWDALYTQLPSFPEDRIRELGFSDLRLAQHADCSFSLGTCFHAARSSPATLLKPHGPVGINYSGVGFHQYWLKTTATKSAEDYFSFSPGTTSMRRKAFAPPVKENAIGPLQHEMVRHVDPWALQKQLRHMAFSMGVREAKSDLQQVTRSAQGDQIIGLITRRDEQLEADLFIDCSGPRRSLRAGSKDTEWVSAPLRTTYSLAVEHRFRAEAPLPYGSLHEQPDGWALTLPRGSEDISLKLTAKATSNDDSSSFGAGHLASPWQGNCVAIGNAAATLLPFEPLQARFFMRSLDLLIQLLPGRGCPTQETGEFNQLIAQDAEEAHSLNALYELHRLCGTLDPDSPEVQRMLDGPLPEALHLRLALFAKRGWLSSMDSQLLPAFAWSSACILLGLIPREFDRLSDRIPRDQVAHNLAALKQRCANLAQGFPLYADYFKAVQEAANSQGQAKS